MRLLEASLADLYDRAVEAFPFTTRRQHVVGDIAISEVRWLPFVGMKTLLCRALASNVVTGTEYRPLILFKGVQYSNEGTGLVDVWASDDGLRYRLRQLHEDQTGVLVRCSCGDFSWRFNYYVHRDHCLYGRVRPKYEALGTGEPANPTESRGICKHLMALASLIRDRGIMRSI